MQYPIDLGCWRIESSVPLVICGNLSLDCAGTVECKTKQRLYRSSVEIVALVNSQGLRICYLGSSLSTTSKKENPIRPLGSPFW